MDKLCAIWSKRAYIKIKCLQTILYKSGRFSCLGIEFNEGCFIDIQNKSAEYIELLIKEYNES